MQRDGAGPQPTVLVIENEEFEDEDEEGNEDDKIFSSDSICRFRSFSFCVVGVFRGLNFRQLQSQAF